MLLAAVHEELHRLPERQRLPLLLHYRDGLNPGEIAQVTGSKLNTVRSHLRRGVEQLRMRLEASGRRLAPTALLLLIGVRTEAAGAPRQLIDGVLDRLAEVPVGSSAVATGATPVTGTTATLIKIAGVVLVGAASLLLATVALSDNEQPNMPIDDPAEPTVALRLDRAGSAEAALRLLAQLPEEERRPVVMTLAVQRQRFPAISIDTRAPVAELLSALAERSQLRWRWRDEYLLIDRPLPAPERRALLARLSDSDADDGHRRDAALALARSGDLDAAAELVGALCAAEAWDWPLYLAAIDELTRLPTPFNNYHPLHQPPMLRDNADLEPLMNRIYQFYPYPGLGPPPFFVALRRWLEAQHGAALAKLAERLRAYDDDAPLAILRVLDPAFFEAERQRKLQGGREVGYSVSLEADAVRALWTGYVDYYAARLGDHHEPVTTSAAADLALAGNEEALAAMLGEDAGGDVVLTGAWAASRGSRVCATALRTRDWQSMDVADWQALLERAFRVADERAGLLHAVGLRHLVTGMSAEIDARVLIDAATRWLRTNAGDRSARRELLLWVLAGDFDLSGPLLQAATLSDDARFRDQSIWLQRWQRMRESAATPTVEAVGVY